MDWNAVTLIGVVFSVIMLAFGGINKKELNIGSYIQQSGQPVLFPKEKQRADTIKVPWDDEPVLMYPNPVKSTLHVVVPRKPASYVWLDIYQTDGQLLKKYAIETGRVIEINVQNLPAGDYIVRVGDRQGQKWSGKFMKAF